MIVANNEGSVPIVGVIVGVIYTFISWVWFYFVDVALQLANVLWTEPRFRKYRSLDWISKRRTGFVKHGLIKRGFIKHELVKHGSMDKTCFINRCFTNPCFINPFFNLINVLAIQVALVHVSDPYLIVCLEPAECAFNSISGLGYVLWFFVYLSLFCTKVMKHQTILYSCYCINNVV